jgi:hypothetical protein
MNGGAEGRPENGRGVKEVDGGEKEGGEVVECDAYSATERGAGELVVVEDVHSRDAAESWRQLLREYDESEGQRSVSWADRCDSPPEAIFSLQEETN